MNKKYIIKNHIDKLGSTVILNDKSWNSMPYKAVISPLWRRKSSDFEAFVTELGTNFSEYYLYIGSFEHNICELSDDAVLKWGNELFEFKHRDVAVVGDEAVYYNAVLRKLRGGNRLET